MNPFRNHHVLIRSKVHPNLQIEIPSEDDYFPRTTANTTPSEIQYNNQVTRSCYSILSIFLLCSPSSLKQYKTKDTNNTTISTKYPKKRETNYFASTRSFYEYKPRHDETILHIRSTELEVSENDDFVKKLVPVCFNLLFIHRLTSFINLKINKIIGRIEGKDLSMCPIILM